MSTLLVNNIESYTGDTVTISSSNTVVTGNTTLGATTTINGNLTTLGAVIYTNLPTSLGAAGANGLYTLSGSQLFSSSAFPGGSNAIFNSGAISSSLFIFTNTSAVATTTSQIISIAHTSGSASVTFNSGQGESNFSQLGMGSDGSVTPLLTGTWRTIASKAQISNIKVKSNIVASDIASASGEGQDYVAITLNQGYMVQAGYATNGARNSTTAGKINQNGSALPSGPAYSGSIGDIGTYVQDSVDINTSVGKPQRVIGNNYLTTPVMNVNGQAFTIASPGYYAYRFSIGEDYPTKVYKFQIDLSYETT